MQKCIAHFKVNAFVIQLGIGEGVFNKSHKNDESTLTNTQLADIIIGESFKSHVMKIFLQMLFIHIPHKWMSK